MSTGALEKEDCLDRGLGREPNLASYKNEEESANDIVKVQSGREKESKEHDLKLSSLQLKEASPHQHT